jgi:hypothetical protein
MGVAELDIRDGLPNGITIDMTSVAYRSAYDLIYRHDAEDYRELIKITD